MKKGIALLYPIPIFIGLFIAYQFNSIWQQPKEKSFFEKGSHLEIVEDENRPDDYMFNARAYPYDYIKPESYRQAVTQVRADRKRASARSASEWTLVGPENTGGRITDIALDPTDTDVIYAGSSVGGIFKSTDAGTTWNQIFDGAGLPSIGNLAIAPSSPQTVYAGTGEANGSATSGAFFGDGVWRSEDGGTNWTQAGLENAQHIGRLVVHPQEASTVYAAVAGALYRKGPDRGLYKTTDGGDTWEQILFVSDSTSCIDVAINPQNPDILFAATWERIRRPWGRSYGGVTSRIYRSTDGGENWIQLQNGLPSDNPERGRIGLTISPSNPDILYASYTINQITNSFDGVYKSEDGGDSWVLITPPNGQIDDVFASFGWFFGNMRVHPTNPDDVFVVGLPLYRSLDGGQNWSDATGFMHVDQHALEIHPLNPSFMVAGNDGGVYISNDGGTFWDHVETIPNTQFYTCEVNPQNPNDFFGGTQDNGTNRSFNGPDAWFRIFGGDGFDVRIDPTDENVIFVEFQFGNMYRTLDGGINWNYIVPFEAEDDRRNWHTPITLDPSLSSTIYYGTQQLFQSFDRGDTWVAISDDLTKGPHPSGTSSFATIQSIAVAPSDSETIYVGTDDGNVQVTQDGGQTWNLVSESLPERTITGIAINYDDPTVAYVVISGYRWNDYLPHVFMTEDAGQTWQDISVNLPEIPVNDIVIRPGGAGDQLFIATDMGVYSADAPGANWEPLGSNFPLSIVADLTLHPPFEQLVAGTFGRSMWEYALPTIVSTKEARVEPDIAIQLQPNPASDRLTIQLSKPDAIRQLDYVT